MRLRTLLLLTLLAGCDGGSTGGARDGGPPGPDAAPARACLPIPPAPGPWQPVQKGKPNSFSRIMNHGDSLLVVDDSYGRLFRSDDHGATWCFVPTPAPVVALHGGAKALYLIPDDSIVPESPTDKPPPEPPGVPPPPPPSRVLWSDDGGDTWTDPGGMLPRQPGMLLPWSSDPQEVVAVLPSKAHPEFFEILGDLWLTRDAGAHWESLRPAGPKPEDPVAWRWLRRDPRDPKALVALAQNIKVSEENPNQRLLTSWLWTSTDEGVEWTMIPVHGSFQDALLRDDATVLGVTTSGDVVEGRLGYVDWRPLSHLDIERASLDVGASGKLYVQGLRELGGPIRTYESSDGGRTWKMFPDQYVQRIPFDWWKGTSLELSPYGLRASDDGGKTWRTLLLATWSADFAAGAGVQFLTNPTSVMRSTEAGVWTGVPLFDEYLTSFLPDPTLADRAYGMLRVRADATPPFSVYTSDGGKSWQPFPISVNGQALERASIVAVAATTPPALLAAGGGAVARSVDGGVTWSRATLPYANLIRVAPGDPNVVYAAGGELMAVSRNGGAEWELLERGPRDAKELVIDPLDPQRLYVRGSYLGKSTDGGLSWKPVRLGVLAGPHHIALSAARPGTVFYVDWTGYIAETSDDGMTTRWYWPPGRVSGLAVDPARPEVLYLSTSAGVFTWALK